MGRWALAVVGVWLWCAGSASAQRAGRLDAPIFELSAGGQATVTAGDVCRQELSDVSSCLTGTGVAGFSISLRLRLAPAWALGALAQLGFGGGADLRTTLGRLAAEGRWYPAGPAPGSGAVPWLGADLGLVWARDALDADELGPPVDYNALAPALGAGAGLDWVFGAGLGLGLELRAAWLGFAGGTGLSRRPDYASQLALTLAAVVVVY